MRTTSLLTIFLVGKLKAENASELAKVTLQDNISSVIPAQFPQHPVQGTHTNWESAINHLQLLLSIISTTSAAWYTPSP